MAAELDRVDGRWERRRFAGSSVLAVVLPPPGPGRRDRITVGGVWAVVAGGAALTAVAVVRYPALRTARHAVPALVVLAVLLATCAVAASILTSRGTATAASLGAAVLVAGCWCGIGAATDLRAGPAVADGLLVSAGVVTVASGALRSAQPLVTAAVTGPVLCLAWTVGVLATAGGPDDPGLVRDFPASGLPDLPSYAVSDGLGSAVALTLMVPLVTVVLAGGTAAVAGFLRRQAACR